MHVKPTESTSLVTQGPEAQPISQNTQWGRTFTIGCALITAAADVITPLVFMQAAPSGSTMFSIGLAWTMTNGLFVGGCALSYALSNRRNYTPSPHTLRVKVNGNTLVPEHG
jgi:hypothetical protein